MAKKPTRLVTPVKLKSLRARSFMLVSNMVRSIIMVELEKTASVYRSSTAVLKDKYSIQTNFQTLLFL